MSEQWPRVEKLTDTAAALAAADAARPKTKTALFDEPPPEPEPETEPAEATDTAIDAEPEVEQPKPQKVQPAERVVFASLGPARLAALHQYRDSIFRLAAGEDAEDTLLLATTKLQMSDEQIARDLDVARQHDKLAAGIAADEERRPAWEARAAELTAKRAAAKCDIVELEQRVKEIELEQRGVRSKLGNLQRRRRMLQTTERKASHLYGKLPEPA